MRPSIPLRQARVLAAGTPHSVLLQTARADPENTRSYLFTGPTEILRAERLDEIPALFARMEQALAQGCYVAGYLGYEAGRHFEPRSLNAGELSRSELPLACFGIYTEPLTIETDSGLIDPEEAVAAQFGEPTLSLAPAEYRAKVETLRRSIAAGDTCQGNLTMRMQFASNAEAAALFQAMMERQPVAYGALLNLGNAHLLSASPELFFRIENDAIVTRPMKGTAPRGRDTREDAAIAAWLAGDEKNRSENVMIVDLMRNDLGRICAMGSIQAGPLFALERHPSLFQMTSTVRGRLRPGIGYYEIFRSLFPPGSIVGAPKLRTMQILHELEAAPRGPYCGAIGYFSPRREAVFSVAIRTLVLRDGRIDMGIGSGIVYDSDADAEYEECRLKAQFLTRRTPPFQLIETLLWDNGYFLLPLHLERLADSADYFDFACDPPAIEDHLRRHAREFPPGMRRRVRLLLSRSGIVTVTSTIMEPPPAEAALLLSPGRTDASDRFLRHKTTHRALYDRAYAEARQRGFDDMLFRNERGELTEGAIHSLFLETNGRLLTPPLASGVLPGVYRRHLLATRADAAEAVLTLDDLRAADHIYLCNSVRGLRRVTRLQE